MELPSKQEILHSPGVLIETTTAQVNLSNQQTFAFKDYLITPLAKFSGRSRALSAQDYRFDREADLAPVDLTFGWRAISDSSALQQPTIKTHLSINTLQFNQRSR